MNYYKMKYLAQSRFIIDVAVNIVTSPPKSFVTFKLLLMIIYNVWLTNSYNLLSTSCVPCVVQICR
jgi:hypothetical protein